MKYFIISLAFLLCGCANLYKKYYTPVIPVDKEEWVKAFQPVFLKKNEKPKIYTVSNIDQTLREYEAKHYVIIGYSNFIATFESTNNLLQTAKQKKATLVIRGYKHKYSSVYGGKYYTSSYQMYHQFAYFLIKVKKKFDLGFQYADLTEKDRMQYKSNTGSIITLVYQDTPAFNANLVRGDIIISCGKQKVQNSADLFKAIINHKGKKGVVLKILRNGKVKKIKITLDKKLHSNSSIKETRTKGKDKTVIGGTF